MHHIIRLAAAAALLQFTAASAPAADAKITVLADDRTIVLDAALARDGQLWVTPDALTEITGFVIKPEGVCRDEVCIPVGRKAADGYFTTEAGRELFNLTKLAAQLKQAVAVDTEHAVWSFGPVAAAGSGLTDDLAPDFELADRQGKLVRLSDFRGKKVLVITWASW